MIHLDSFEPLVLHKYIDVDGFAGAQCWDLQAYFTDWLGLPRINTFGGLWHGWAYAMWDQYHNNGASHYWDQIPPHASMEQGDIIIWKPTPGIYPASHVAVGIEDANTSVWCYSQNSGPSWANNPYPGLSSAPVLKQLLPKTGLAGYLRRKSSIQVASTPSPEPIKKEWDEMASKEDFKNALREVLEEPATLDKIALAVLKRPCYLIDASGNTREVVGTTTLATKINWMAHNDTQHRLALQAIGESLGVKMDVILGELTEEDMVTDAVPSLDPIPVPEKVANPVIIDAE